MIFKGGAGAPGGARKKICIFVFLQQTLEPSNAVGDEQHQVNEKNNPARHVQTVEINKQCECNCKLGIGRIALFVPEQQHNHKRRARPSHSFFFSFAA